MAGGTYQDKVSACDRRTLVSMPFYEIVLEGLLGCVPLIVPNLIAQTPPNAVLIQDSLLKACKAADF